MGFNESQATNIYPFGKVITTPQDSYADFCSAYQKRELEQNFIMQLNHLIKDVQLHRGISMRLLAGNKSFEKDFKTLQSKINRRLSTLLVFSTYDKTLFSIADKKNIQLSWDTIRNDWQDDKLTDNFELHSHFIEQLLLKILDISNNLRKPLLDELQKSADSGGSGDTDRIGSEDNERYPRQIKQMELLNFICSLLPISIENMAKIRGLASFAAEIGCVHESQQRKLRYLLQCAREDNVKAGHCSQRLHSILGDAFNAKSIVGEFETKFVYFIELVSRDVLSGSKIQTSSWQIFNLGTNIIDKYWQIVDEGLNLLRIWQRDDFNAWVNS